MKEEESQPAALNSRNPVGEYTPPTPSALSTQHSALPRRGSVLLIVVVLLLMLAILGTSYLSTTQVDRIVSAQEVSSANVDQITGSVKDIAVSAIVNSLFAYNSSGYEYRGATNSTTIGPYNHFDIPVYNYYNAGDSWLADRVPVPPGLIPTPQGAPTALVPLPKAAWAAITAPLISQPLPSGASAFEFEDPTVIVQPFAAVTTPAVNQYNPYNSAVIPNNQLPVYPTFKTIIANGVSTTYPALFVPNSANATNTTGVWIAGDADGDGIADCGLVRLPGAYADGLTYYAGIRIVDNNSAININTAVDNITDPVAAFPPLTASASDSWTFGYFPGDVGLGQMLNTPAELTSNLLPYLLNYNGSAATAASSTVRRDDGKTLVPAATAWGSLDELLNFQLANRIGNPGFVRAAQPLQPIPSAEQANLAYRGGVFANTGTFTNSGGVFFPLSVSERLLLNSVFGTAANINLAVSTFPSSSSTSYPLPVAPFTTAGVMSAWFGYNYTYAAYTGPGSPGINNPRPLLVVRNPVSNATPVTDSDPPNQSLPNALMLPTNNVGQLRADVTYYPGDIVWWGSKIYVCFTKQIPTAVPLNISTAPAANFTQPVLYPSPTPANPTPNAPAYPKGSVVAFSPATYVAPLPIPNPAFPPTFQQFYGTLYNYLTNYNATITYPIITPGPMRLYQAIANVPANTPPPNALYWQPLTGTPHLATKASINTAGFPELFRAFWGAMAADAEPGCTPFGNEPVSLKNTYGTAFPGALGNGIYTGNQFVPNSPTIQANTPVGQVAIPPALFASIANVYHKQRMFRSSIRDNRTPSAEPFGFYFPPAQEMQLRAALAAVNTLNLRTANNATAVDNTAEIQLTAVKDSVAVPVNVRVYGVLRQPYITEVYANTETTAPGGNTKPYVAIKLFNPYSTPIDISKWGLGYIYRQNASLVGPYVSGGGLYLNDISVAAASPPSGAIAFPITQVFTSLVNGGTFNGIIPARSYLVLDNFGSAGVTFRPTETGMTSNPPIYCKVSDLGNIVQSGINGGGLELVLLAYPVSGVPATINDYIPADSFDFTGINSAAYNATAWHYARNDPNGSPGNWQWVYPGRYDGSQNGNPRHQGTQVAVWNSPSQVDPWDSTQMGGPPTPPGVPSFSFGIANQQALATYPSVRACRLMDNTSSVWPSAAGSSSYPYGLYARAGDVLMAPYFGAYRVEDTSNTLLYEMNSAPMDSAFADESIASDDTTNFDLSSQLGRFSPAERDLITYHSPSATSTILAKRPVLTSGNVITDPSLQSPAALTSLYNNNVAAATWVGWDVLVTQMASTGAPQIVTPVQQIRHIALGGWNLATPTQIKLDTPIIDYTTGAPITTGTSVNITYSLIRPSSWTAHILDYVSQYSPRSDNLPNLDPNAYFAPGNTLQPVTNDNAAVTVNNSSSEDTVGTDGLININTAPWRVLAALPLVLTTTGAVDQANSALMAQQIVIDRQQYGPFKTLFDLNRVYFTKVTAPFDEFERPGFRNATTLTTVTPPIKTSPTQFLGQSNGAQGNIASLGATGSTVPNEFDELNLQVTRLSNLITTRSDTFTVYIVIEGWQNAGSTNAATPPKLVLTRRAAYIVDRNTVTPYSRAVKTLEVPND